jgi:outer membrane lipoprotein-sorting protein
MAKVLFAIITTSIFLSANYVYGAEDNTLLVDKLAGKNGFKMTFEQSSKYKFLKVPKASKGKLTFVPPKSFIWEIDGDNAGKIISNGKKTWIYSVADETEDTPTVIVKKGVYEGVQSLVFNPRYKVADLVKKGNFKELRVTGSKSKGYLWAELRFTETPDFRIDTVVFEDVEGTKVTIKAIAFDRISKSLDASAFDFVAPKGSRIIIK